MLLTPILAMLALVFSAGSASAVVGGTTIGGCIYTGEGTATYTPGPVGPITTWDTTYAGAEPITDAQVMIQNMHSGGAHIMYGTMGVGGANCWEATIPDTKVAGTPDVPEVIAVIAAPGHAVTTREFNWDPDGRFSAATSAIGIGAPPWTGGATMGHFMHPTGVHPEAGADCTGAECLSDWATGPQDAYLMSYPQKTTSLLHYVFYDNFTNGNDNGPISDPGVNGVTVNVYDEHGTVVASQKTGDLAFSQGGFITDDGVLISGSMAYGYVYFTGLPGDDEYLIQSDPSTVIQADNPHFTLSLTHDGIPGSCISPLGDGHGYDKASCKWWQTYTEERGHLGEAYAWPGSPGTMDGGYLTWHGLVEKLPSAVGGGNPALWGTISGILLDSTGADPGEATTIAHGGRVPPTNARFENGIAWNRTRSAAGWGGTPNPGEPASDVIPNSRVMDGRVVLFDLNETSPKVVATAVATNPTDYNDPATGGTFEFTSVPPGTYGLYAMDRDLNYVMFVGNTATVTPGGAASAGLMLYERWGARSMGFIERNGGPATGGYTVKNWFKAGTTKNAVQSDPITAWFENPFWPETGQMGFQFVDMVDGADFRGKIVTEKFQDVPVQLGFDVGPITYNWATHNSMNRAVGYATHNYFVDLQIEDIPLAVGNISGPVFFDHFSYKPDPAKHNRANGVYGEDEDRLWQGWTVELYNAPALPGSCADLALPLAPASGQYCSAGLKTLTSEIGTFSCTLDSDCDTAPGAGDGKCAVVPNGLIDVKKTGKFTKSDNVKLGWNQPYTYPADEIGSMHAGPVRIMAGGGAIVPPALDIPEPPDYVATAYPNIGTSLLETEAYVDSFDYAPMPGYYEFRDVAPGEYCVRALPKNGYRHSPDTDVEPGGFKLVTVTGGLNSRVELGTNTTPTQPAGLCEVPVASQNAGSFYTSLNGNGIGLSVVGYSATFKVRDEDILFYDGANFHMYFDGSVAGLPGYSDIDALQVVDSDTFYVSFLAPNSKNRQVVVPAGVTSAPFIADDEDIVLYDAGDWSLYLDGSLYGLGDINGEDIDALSMLGNGSLVISTRGSANAGGATNVTPLTISSTTGWTGTNPRPQDEDLLIFDGVGFDMYFDASDVALHNGPDQATGGAFNADNNNEDVWGVNVGPNGDIYLSTYKPFMTASGLTGNGYDIFTCRGAGTGRTSSCVSNDLDFAGLIANGFDNITHETLDAISILRAGTCSNGTSYSCTMDAQCEDVAHPWGIKLAGEIEGGMWDGMEALDTNPTSLLFMDAIAMFGSPIAVKDGNDYFLGVGYQGDTRCHGWNNFLHTPGTSMFPIGGPGYDSFACRSTVALSQKPEFERRFAPGANRYIGNAPGFLWNRIDPSIPAGWYGQDEHNANYESMELGIGVPQAGYKFEAAWTPLLITGAGGGGVTADFCATGLAATSFPGEPPLWNAVVTITATDGFSGVQDAEVIGTWSDGTGQTCITGVTGQCSIVHDTAGGGANNVTFTVDAIVPDQNQPWYVYNANTGGILNGACMTSVTVYDPSYVPPSPACDDGIDNDGDGLVDFPLDLGCTSVTDTDEAGPYQCSDGLDNDGDLLFDFPADPGCVDALDNNEEDAPPPPPAPACSDGIDNDGDTFIDWPTDPGCVDALDNDEFNAPPVLAACMNGIDDDGDTLIDMLDPGCANITDNDETDPPVGGPASVHVIGYAGSPTWNEGKLIGNVTITVEDDLLGLVDGATADFTYTWLKEGVPTQKQMSCVTDITGVCTATTQEMENAGFVDISLDAVAHPSLPYEYLDNTVGTLITVP